MNEDSMPRPDSEANPASGEDKGRQPGTAPQTDMAPRADTVRLDSQQSATQQQPAFLQQPVSQPQQAGDAGQGQPGSGWGTRPVSTGWGWGPAETTTSAVPQGGTDKPGMGESDAGQPGAGQSGISQPVVGWGLSPAGSAKAAAGAGGWGGVSGAGRAGAWTLKRGLVVGGVATVLAAATAAGVYAATNSSAAEIAGNGTSGPGVAGGQPGQGGMGAQGMPGAQGMQGTQGGGFGPDGMGMGMAGLNAAIHSEYVILRDQSYVTLADQLGTVTAISADSISVKSEDGFNRTYSLGSDVQVGQGMRQRNGTGTSGTVTLADIKTGAAVRITAAKNGDAYAAETIRLVTTGTGAGQSSTQGSTQGSSSN